MKNFGIDISVYQGTFDLEQAMHEGVRFAILKGGGGDDGLYVDRMFSRNYDLAKTLGLPIGVYWFSKALTMEEAVEEAKYFYENVLSGRSFELPIYIDVENRTQLSIGADALTATIRTWCAEIQTHGVRPGVYSSLSYFKNCMHDEQLQDITHWVAQYNDVCEYAYPDALGIWQFGGGVNYIRTNKVAGVTCDQDYMLQDLIGDAFTPTQNEATSKNESKESVYMELPVLREGSFGPAVHAAMVLMKAKGYYDGYCDDLFGPKMGDGLERMQRENDLGVDRVFGKNSWTYVLLT